MRIHNWDKLEVSKGDEKLISKVLNHLVHTCYLKETSVEEGLECFAKETDSAFTVEMSGNSGVHTWEIPQAEFEDHDSGRWVVEQFL